MRWMGSPFEKWLNHSGGELDMWIDPMRDTIVDTMKRSRLNKNPSTRVQGFQLSAESTWSLYSIGSQAKRT